ncbi:undecaprenyl-diphosphate phosphatase [Candidatus Dojkabacteria bacterium]|nr:undecaprenyl-diphosphate phosphatase [Candidatus Dojkabacteria bacterium]
MFEAAILGLIQGLTEFLPISSSAHLVILPELLGWEEHSNLFDVFLHGGTLFALVFTYRDRILKFFLNRENFLKIALATLPSIVAGFFLLDYIDSLKSTLLIAFMLVSIGILLIITDYIAQANSKKQISQSEQFSIKQIPGKTSILMGLAQPLAYFRGTSRSGITIITGVFSGLSLKDATNYSFILGIPIISAGVIYSVFELLKDSPESINLAELMTGFVTSFIFGLIAIKIMLTLTQKIGLKYFGLYRIILAVILLIFLA